MRYVIINELYRMGGSEVQSLREQKMMKDHGHEVLYITFDESFPNGIDTENSNHINIVCHYGKVSKRIYRLTCDRKLVKEISSLLANFNPDYIHVNIAAEHALAIFKAVKGYPTFQTIRDYSVVCETGLCVDRQFQICKGKKYHNCMSKCMPDNNKAMFIYYCLVSRAISKARRRSICQFVCPSQRLTDYCNDHGLNTQCINNPFDFTFLNKFKKDKIETKKIYFFYGFVAEHKGIKQLLDAFSRFAKERSVELWIAGKVSPDMENVVDAADPQVHYLGVKKYDEIISILSKVYAVIVPSLWMENYPNTVLEGLCTKCLVIASNRGGMREMIRDDRFIFDVLNQDDFVSKLEFSYELTEAEYQSIVNRNLEFVRKNNSIETYYHRIQKLLPTLHPMKGFYNVENSYITSHAGNNLGGGRATIQIPDRELLCA